MRTALSLSCLLFSIPLTLSSQTASPKKQLVPSIPASDRSSRVLLTNPSISVHRLELAARTSAQIPAAYHDYLLIGITPAHLEASGAGTVLDVQLGGGEMQVMQGGWPHKLFNKGDDAANLLAIEIARNIDPRHASCGLSTSDCHEVRFGKQSAGEYSQSALFETSTTKLLRAQLSPGGALTLHADSRKHLLVAVSDVSARADGQSMVLRAGEVHWIEGGFEELVNDGKADAQLLIVELKR